MVVVLSDIFHYYNILKVHPCCCKWQDFFSFIWLNNFPLCVYVMFYISTPVLLPGESHGRRSLVGCSQWGSKQSDTTERLPFHFSLSCIGEGNGNPLQCSCLENPGDGEAWWAAIYGVPQSDTTEVT